MRNVGVDGNHMVLVPVLAVDDHEVLDAVRIAVPKRRQKDLPVGEALPEDRDQGMAGHGQGDVLRSAGRRAQAGERQKECQKEEGAEKNSAPRNEAGHAPLLRRDRLHCRSQP